MSRTKADWEENVHHEIPSATVHANGVAATCGCGEIIEVKFARGRLPPVPIRKKILNAGWRLTTKAAICPQCQRKDDPMPEVTAIPLPSVAQSPDARKVHRAVMGWLEQAYDEIKRTYQPGFSDKSIADETGAAVEYVAKCREDYFGPIAVPSELTKLRAEIADTTRMIESEAKDHAYKIDALVKAHNAALDRLRTRQSVAEERLRDLVKKNGWAE